MKIVYKHQAVLDIRQTQEYIAETLGNKRAAQKLVASILKAISLLEENPMTVSYTHLEWFDQTHSRLMTHQITPQCSLLGNYH